MNDHASPTTWWDRFRNWLNRLTPLRGDEEDEYQNKTQEQRIQLKAARDVMVLAAYLSRQKNIDIAAEDRSKHFSIPHSIIEAIHKNEPPAPDDLGKLHQMLSELTKKAAPATPESVLDSSYANRLGIRQRREQNWWMAAITATGSLAFILTFLLGLYVTITEVVISDEIAGREEALKLSAGGYDGTRVAAYFEARKSLGLPGVDDGKGAAGTTDLLTRKTDFIGSALSQIALETAWRENLLSWSSSFFDSSPKQGAAKQNAADSGNSIFASRVVMQQVYINRIISAFIMPIGASLTGALVFILRDRARREDNTSLEVRASKRYAPRMLVAVIAGVIIGWFTGRDSSGILATLTPAALAFVVGYSLEIFFNLLDSIKTALGVKDT